MSWSNFLIGAAGIIAGVMLKWLFDELHWRWLGKRRVRADLEQLADLAYQEGQRDVLADRN